MKILVSSIIDLKNSVHNSRLHQFLKYLSRDHDISVLSVNDCWKARWDRTAENYNQSFKDLFENIDLFYLTDRQVSPVVQEALSVATVGGTLDKIGISDYDVHFNYNGMVSGYAVGRSTHSRGIPTVYDIADDLPEMVRTSPQIPSFMRSTCGWVGKAILNWSIRTSERVTITTESLCQTYDIPCEKWELLPNGVDIELFSPRPCGHIKEKYGLEDSFVVGHVGVLREWLDLEPLFIAIRELASKSNVKLLIVGGGAGYDKTVEMARDLGIQEHTVFTGTVPYSQVPEYISCMNVGVIPFKQDNVSNNSLPLKLFEYMACGIPVISTHVDAIEKGFGQTVRFVSDVNEYVQGIMELYQDPKLCSRLGAEGSRIVADEYQWAAIAKKLDRILIKAGC
ncbi:MULTISPECIES: glycosyltransferase [Methanoculleus]|uniref:Glycosyl transferase, group 1 n=2 Tax=Methanoculleus TaxID=45989 RepID=A3CY67_METMJ|nr:MULTISPECIES: glycosyltransferase [Methanoculleus]ABN58317.1 glycosyl transferase, group 1 [Methanoculleus marisnigri JR1]MCC7554557.1 glycosyltransferase [Methanoculleus marisnigri]UYU17318.1 glycosyltransferase [Methanoculleus submarinus]